MTRRNFILPALSLLALTGCGASNVFPLEFPGTSKAVGNGRAMSFVSLSADNKPTAIGIRLTDGALEGLATVAPFGVEYVLDIAVAGKDAGLPFDHIGFDWNPSGHEPAGIYDLPHFDMHFYTISEADRNVILPGPGAAAIAAAPPASAIPAGYFPPPGDPAAGVVPRMGVHYTSPSTSPELSGATFTKTMIYGFANAKLAFVEPMITRAYLLSKTNYSANLTVPATVAKPGYYPTRWSIKHGTDGSIDIVLDQFVKR